MEPIPGVAEAVRCPLSVVRCRLAEGQVADGDGQRTTDNGQRTVFAVARPRRMAHSAPAVLVWVVAFYALTQFTVSAALDRWFPPAFETVWRHQVGADTGQGGGGAGPAAGDDARQFADGRGLSGAAARWPARSRRSAAAGLQPGRTGGRADARMALSARVARRRHSAAAAVGRVPAAALQRSGSAGCFRRGVDVGSRLEPAATRPPLALSRPSAPQGLPLARSPSGAGLRPPRRSAPLAAAPQGDPGPRDPPGRMGSAARCPSLPSNAGSAWA